MPRFAAIFLLTILPLLSHAAEKPTVLKALKAIPKGEEKNLARVEAHGGTPLPDRWHFLVYNAEAEAGLKEYVVANGELIATREVSQFADSLTAADVIGRKAVQVDADKLAKLAQDYAAANGVTVATLSYQLFKDGDEAQPAWRVICNDQAGEPVGTLVVTAAKGKVVSQEGLPLEPKAGKRTKAKLQFRTEAQPMVAVVDESEAEGDAVDGSDVKEDGAQEVEPEAVGELASTEERDDSNAERQTYIRKQGTNEKKSGEASSRSRSKRTVHRGSVRVPNPIGVAKGVTRPVRHIVRRLLPF